MVSCEACGREAIVLAGTPDFTWQFECEVCQTGRWYYVYLSDIAADPDGRIDHVEQKSWVGPEFRQKVNQYIGD